MRTRSSSGLRASKIAPTTVRAALPPRRRAATSCLPETCCYPEETVTLARGRRRGPSSLGRTVSPRSPSSSVDPTVESQDENDNDADSEIPSDSYQDSKPSRNENVRKRRRCQSPLKPEIDRKPTTREALRHETKPTANPLDCGGQGLPLTDNASLLNGVKGLASPRRNPSTATLDNSSSEGTPAPSTPKTTRVSAVVTPSSVYKQAKSLFKTSSTPSRLVGRDKQRSVIHDFLKDLPPEPTDCRSRSLYVSGCPGAGKSALVDEVLKSLDKTMEENGVKCLKVNCMALSEPKDVFHKILEGFGLPLVSKQKDAISTLESAFSQQPELDAESRRKRRRSSPSFYVLILDEIDQLACTDQSVLYRIFEWPTRPRSSLALIGIANQLDLMERYLPRLSSMDGRPEVLNFPPYEANEITFIITDRLRDLEDNVCAQLSGAEEIPGTPTKSRTPGLESIMLPSAVEYASRKASGTGDLRFALDICRQSIEAAEVDVKRAPGSMADTPIKGLNEVPKVTVKHVVRASSDACGPGPVQRIAALGTQHKAVLASLLKVMQLIEEESCSKKRKLEMRTIPKLYGRYQILCKEKKLLTPVSRTEFGDILSLLETTGLVNLSKGKAESDRTVELLVAGSQVIAGIDGLLANLWE
ncbi:P-loop containing nucleoside triphosphate hydrolase protein [Zopfochytrium polystomum]|nr:P-loop containing nucleoside triphosphate hydrolase protein [Zopfochytrium polystomum]